MYTRNNQTWPCAEIRTDCALSSVDIILCARCHCKHPISPDPAKLNYFKFHPLKVVSQYCDPQLQVAENY